MLGRAGRDRELTPNGKKMRIALAALLLRRPALLLLDEPTNHLDAAAKAWLADYLAEYVGTVVLVSHDRALLDVACSQVAEISNRRLTLFAGDYSTYLRKREARLEQQAKEYEATRREMAKLQGFVDKYGAKASKASSAQSRKKQLAKMEAGLGEALEAGRGRPRPRLVLPPALPCHGEHVIELEAAQVG